MDDTIKEFVNSIQQLPEITFEHVFEAFPSGELPDLQNTDDQPASSAFHTSFKQLAEYISAFKACKLQQLQRATLETHQLKAKKDVESYARQLKQQNDKLPPLQQSLHSAYRTVVQTQETITPPSPTAARYHPEQPNLQYQQVKRILEQANLQRTHLYVLDTKLTIYNLDKAIELSTQALRKLSVLITPYQTDLQQYMAQYQNKKKNIADHLDTLNTLLPDLTELLTKNTLQKEIELLTTGLNACKTEKENLQRALKTVSSGYLDKTPILDKQFDSAPDKEAFVLTETSENITLSQCIETATAWVEWAIGSHANASTEQEAKQKETHALQRYLKARLSIWTCEQRITTYTQKIEQCRNLLQNMPSTDSTPSTSNLSHILEKLRPLLDVQRQDIPLLEYIQLTKEKIESLSKDIEQYQSILSHLNHLWEAISDIRHQRQTAQITLPSAELFHSSDEARQFEEQSLQRNEHKEKLSQLMTYCETFSNHYTDLQQLHKQISSTQKKLQGAQCDVQRITQKLEPLDTLEVLVSKETALKKTIEKLAQQLKIPPAQPAIHEPVILPPNAAEEKIAPLVADEGLPETVQNCFSKLQKHVEHLRKDGFEKEAVCLEKAVERFRQLANNKERAPEEAPLSYDFYKTEPYFESLHHHRGVLKLLETLAEFCMALYAALFQKTQSSYRDCFFFKPTHTSQYLAETERCLLNRR